MTRDGLGQVVLDAHLARRFDHVDVVKGAHHDDEYLRQARVRLSQPLLQCLHVLGLRDTVHLWHLNVRENHLVADVAARLRHARLVHLHCDKTVDRLVTPFAELVLDDSFERHQVE